MKTALGPTAAPLGVTGVVVHGGEALVGLRGDTALAGQLELVPAGTLDRGSWAQPDALVLGELAEEVPAAWDVDPQLLGLHQDPSSGVWDLVYLLVAREIPRMPTRGPEHQSFHWTNLGASAPDRRKCLGPLATLWGPTA